MDGGLAVAPVVACLPCLPVALGQEIVQEADRVAGRDQIVGRLRDQHELVARRGALAHRIVITYF